MNCCGAHSEKHSSDNASNTNQEEKKVSWLAVVLTLIMIGLLIFSILI